jgi:glycerophosphoryl diester phosphodiesterase
VPAEAFFSEQPIAVAHRGSRLLWPENTMHAFGEAATTGVSTFETDVRATLDGEAVCFHDPLLDRTTDRTGPLDRLTREDLSGVDAGYRHRTGGAYPFRGMGIGVPRLVELATAFPSGRFIVDLKSEAAIEPVAEVISALDLYDRIIVGSFSDARLAEFRRLTGGKVGTSTGQGETIGAIMAGAAGSAPAGEAIALQVPPTWYGLPVVTPSLVRAARRAGKLVHVWTINDGAEMERLLAMGVDGIITDRPDLVFPLIGS